MTEGNNPELILIKKLRDAFSDQFEEEFSNNKLSGFFGSRSLISEALSKKRKFSERIIYRIKKSIEENLTEENRENALNALFVYLGDGKKQNSNQPEIDFIESLRDIISSYQGIPIDYTNLGRFFENQALFHNALKRKTSFKEYIIDKIEWIINQKSDEKSRIQALKILKKYRISKNYRIGPSTPVEELISALQESFSNQNNKFFTKSEISSLIGGKSLLSFSAKNNSKLYQLSLILLEKKIEGTLTGINKIKALQALKTYKKKIGYSVDSPEIEFIKVLVNTFSNVFQRDFNLTELGELIASKSIINEALRKKTAFTKLTLDKIEKTILENLKGENLNKALNALSIYKLKHGHINESEADKSTETKLAERMRRIFNSYYNEVLSYNKIGEMLGDRQLFSRIFYEKKVLKKETINNLIENAKNVLDGENLNEIISVLKNYSQLRRYEKKIEVFNADSKLNEEICRCIFEELFHPYKFPTVSIFTFNWLIGPNGGSMHIDGFNIELNLGFEFNGIQHYEIDGFFNKTKIALEKRQKSDSHKEYLIKKHGRRVIIIPYTVKIKERVNFIIEKCRKLGFDISKNEIKIDLKQIEKRARDQIKNRKNKKNDLKKADISHSILLTSHSLVPYPNFNQPQTKIDEDFTDPYLWFSPQVREAIRSKAESLIGQVREEVSVSENFSDTWDEVSNYDRSEVESNSAEDISDTPNKDIIPEQDIESDPEDSEIQGSDDIKEPEISDSDDDIEDLITEQEELTEAQISDLEQINDSDDREGDKEPENVDPITQPDYDPLTQPISGLIPPPEPSTNPEDINTPGQEKGTETPNSPQTQQEQEESTHVPEKSQDVVGTEQNIEEVSDNSNEQDAEAITSELNEEIQNPDQSVSEQEDISDNNETDSENPENVNQNEDKESTNPDEKDEDADNPKDENEEIGDKEKEDKGDKKEEDNKDGSEDEVDKEKNDEIDELPREVEDESKEGEQEPDSDPQEGGNDDMDDFEEDSEHGFDPEDINDPINVIDYGDLIPLDPAYQSSNLDPNRGDIIVIDGDDFREPIDDIQIKDDDLKEKETDDIPTYDDDGSLDDLPNDEIKDETYDELDENFY